MNHIQIEGELDRGWLVTLISEGYSTYDIIKNYDLTENLIVENFDLFEKDAIIEGLSLSEDSVRIAIEKEFFTNSDIKNLTMSTYSKFSEEFISEYSEYINWTRLIMYISTQSDDFNKYIEIIDENNLWSYISANDLPIDFIREYKDKLDWKYLSMVKCFTDEEKEEFVNYILYNVSEEVEGDFIDNSQFGFVKNMSDEELESLIEEINKKLYPENWPK